MPPVPIAGWLVEVDPDDDLIHSMVPHVLKLLSSNGLFAASPISSCARKCRSAHDSPARDACRYSIELPTKHD